MLEEEDQIEPDGYDSEEELRDVESSSELAGSSGVCPVYKYLDEGENPSDEI